MKKIGSAVLSALVVAATAFPQQALYDGNHTGAKPGKAILGPGFRQ